MTENISMNKTMKDKCLERKRTESKNRKTGNRSNEINNRLDNLKNIEKIKRIIVLIMDVIVIFQGELQNLRLNIKILLIFPKKI